MKNNPFLSLSLREIPRLLSQLDRNPLSDTYGSFDRAFWLYRTNDISSMRYQEAAVTLAILYKNPFEGNLYYGKKDIKEWANAAINFACKKQRSDGSFDEWYINEGSFVCTAFVAVAISKAVLVLGEDLAERKRVVVTLERACEWLMKRSETMVLNQLSGAVVALYNTHKITGKDIFRIDAEKKLQYILAKQHEEGWWDEYGGPDIGYLSLTIDYLSQINGTTYDDRTKQAIEKASAFALNFLHPDGTAGGEYMSRNTEYLILPGFVRAGSYSSSAKRIVLQAETFLEKGEGLLPQSLDDRYICYILYTWIEAGLLWQSSPLQNEPLAMAQTTQNTFFSDAGILVEKNDQYQLFANAKKGGSARLYTSRGQLIDAGIAIRMGGNIYASNVLSPETHIEYLGDTHVLMSSGVLLRVKTPLLTTPYAVIFKAVQFIVGSVPVFQRLFKHVLRVRGVTKPGTASKLMFSREIFHSNTTVTITDTVFSSIKREDFIDGVSNIFALVPSSRYYPSTNAIHVLTPTKETYETTDSQSRLVRTFTV